MEIVELHEALVPYVLTFGRNGSRLNLDLDLGDDTEIEVLRVEDEDNAEFCQMLNLSNQAAFGGPHSMGMPLWVMLDCAIMPCGMAGFMIDSNDVPDALWRDWELDDDYDGWVPVSEYSAALTVEPGCVSGFSLHARVNGQGIATRTKALALALLDAKAQIGVTQFDNPAIRVHAKFGPMELLVHRPAIHTHAENSFIYRLQLPELQTLERMAREEVDFGDPRRPDGVPWAFDPDDEMAHSRLRSHIDAGGRAWIVAPGWRGTEDGCEIDLILGE